MATSDTYRYYKRLGSCGPQEAMVCCLNAYGLTSYNSVGHMLSYEQYAQEPSADQWQLFSEGNFPLSVEQQEAIIGYRYYFDDRLLRRYGICTNQCRLAGSNWRTSTLREGAVYALEYRQITAEQAAKWEAEHPVPTDVTEFRYYVSNEPDSCKRMLRRYNNNVGQCMLSYLHWYASTVEESRMHALGYERISAEEAAEQEKRMQPLTVSQESSKDSTPAAAERPYSKITIEGARDVTITESAGRLVTISFEATDDMSIIFADNTKENEG